jgi:hypothetical protein
MDFSVTKETHMKTVRIVVKVIMMIVITSTITAILPKEEGMVFSSSAIRATDWPVISPDSSGESQQQPGQTETPQLSKPLQTSLGQMNRLMPTGIPAPAETGRCIRTLEQVRIQWPTTTVTATPAPTLTNTPTASPTATPTSTPTTMLIMTSSISVTNNATAAIQADTSTAVPPEEEIEELLREKEQLETELRNIEEVIEEKKEALLQAEAEVQELESRLQNEASENQALEDQIVHKQLEAGELRAQVANLEAQRESVVRDLGAVNDKLYNALLEALTVLEQALREEILEENDILRWQIILGFLTVGAMLLTIVTNVLNTAILTMMKRIFRKKGGIALESLTSPVPAGSSATLTIRAQTGTLCTPCMIYQSGKASPRGLEPKTVGSSGEVSWTWRVHPNTKPGTWLVCVDCDPGGSMQWPFVVDNRRE